MMNANVYRETFVSPFHKDTESEALRVLDAIREGHPASSGWVEIRGYVEKLPSGKCGKAKKLFRVMSVLEVAINKEKIKT